jgi:predicted SAM-dependent methyltransferase
MLLEIHRILRDGGKLRVSTPDFDFFLGMFRQGISPEEKQFMEWHVRTYTPNLPVHPLSMMNTMFHRWGHKFLYSEQTLSLLLQECGFGHIVRYRTGESDDSELQGLESHGKLVGESHNRMETLVLEAMKSTRGTNGAAQA